MAADSRDLRPFHVSISASISASISTRSSTESGLQTPNTTQAKDETK
jgi:hypothetical protein